jgi:hypothetical protein
MATPIHRQRIRDHEFLDARGPSAIDRTGASPPKKTTENSSDIDAVISALGNAYENKRARQVVEWEKQWRQNVFDLSLH